VCGRTLLRGERAEAYLHGGARRWVCELCKSRALHEGWIREGTLPSYDGASSGSERRRSLFGRLRGRIRDVSPDLGGNGAAEQYDDRAGRAPEGGPPPREATPPPAPSRRPRPRERERERAREPRHVRAVPTSPEHKTASAVMLFNSSEHPRTVAGVARSLGLPGVAVMPSAGHASLVNVVVSWELCWYRYEVDLSEEVPSVRVAAQGYELDELSPEERIPNAVATEHGTLELG
jgi:hypothetical protein